MNAIFPLFFLPFLLRCFFGGCISLLFCVGAQAQTARIAILIDDMGDNPINGERALRLPGPISYAFLPHTTHSKRFARAAHELGRDVLLHAPMQSETRLNLMGPGALTLAMSEEQLRTQLQENIRSIPFVSGFNNHMGSVLTRDRERMQWVMQEARESDLFFVDSRTVSDSVARSVAHEHQVPNVGRDVFLDHDPNRRAIESQFRRLISIAREHGSALAIGHPTAMTLTVLEEQLKQLHDSGDIELVSVSTLLRASRSAQADLSPRHKTGPALTTRCVTFFIQSGAPAWRTAYGLPNWQDKRCEKLPQSTVAEIQNTTASTTATP